MRAGRATDLKMAHKFDAAAAGRKMRVAVVGGGPSGACAAEIFAQVSLHWKLLFRRLHAYETELRVFLRPQSREERSFSGLILFLDGLH